MIMCSVLIGLADIGRSGSETTSIYGVERPKMSAYVAVLITLICPVTFASTALSTRIFKMRFAFPPMEQRMTT